MTFSFRNRTLIFLTIFFVIFIILNCSKIYAYDQSYLSFIEYLFPDFLSLIEESGGFTVIDFQAISVYDNSFLITDWFLNSSNFSNPIIPGSSLFIPVTYLIDFINISLSNIILEYNFDRKSFINFSYTNGYNNFSLIVGKYLYDFINSLNVKSFLLGIHPLEREISPFHNRRHLKYQTSFNFFFNLEDYNKTKQINNNNFVNLYFLKGERSFNSFYYDSNNNMSYLENYFVFQVMHNINLITTLLDKNFYCKDENLPYFIYELRYISNFKNQCGFQYEQTLKFSYTMFGIFSQKKYQDNIELNKNNEFEEQQEKENYSYKIFNILNNLFYKNLNLIRESNFSYSIYFINSDFKHINPSFFFNIIDPDGEGLFPIYFEGFFDIFVLNFINVDLNNILNLFGLSKTKDLFKLKFNTRNTFFIFNYYNDSIENKIYYQNAEYGKININYEKQLFYNSINEIFFSSNLSLLSNYILSINAGLGINLYLNNNLLNNLFLVSPFFEIKLANIKKDKKVSPYFYIYKQNVYLNFEYLKYLNPNFFDVYVYYKNNNNDFILINTLGGKFTKVDNKLKLPSIYGAIFGTDFIINNNFTINLEFSGKIILNKFILVFDDDINKYMYYENINETIVYFYKEGEKYYILKNSDNRYLDYSISGKIELIYLIDQKLFIKTAFKTHQVVGVTTFGNGFSNNDLLALDYSFANPNTYYSYFDKTSYGRTDNDRAYIFNFIMGFRILDEIWCYINIRYKDGQPFSFYRIFQSSSGQIAYLFDTIQAENIYGIKGGPREDSLWRIDLIININNFLKIAFYNILDIGNEFGENQFNVNNRSALELNFPLTISFELSFYF
ncbi:MAG: hypothetical protein N3A58_05445 [Spirochaetes bacterium]|nr:hypothetical protein [Spirochaetota bacterium]